MRNHYQTQHPEPAYEFNDIKRTRKFDSSIIYALLFFLVLGLMAFKSNAAEKPTKLSKSVKCAATSKKSGQPCKMVTYSPDSLCRVHGGKLYKK